MAVMLCGIGQAAVHFYTLIYEMTAEFLIPIQFEISAMPVSEPKALLMRRRLRP
jgi:hypothetical protein